MAQILLIIGAMIFGFLGSVHLFYTFFSSKFDPYDIAVKKSMQNSTLVLTKQTSLWNAWIGFNASHSLGAILVALFYIPLSLSHNELIQNSLWFSFLPTCIGFSYLILAKRYWFNIPFVGILIATTCFLTSALLYRLP
jgi:hypothetical protein